jgi:16S rRNA (adenine1518-N6/adenine1519-N6)-dimethyltransferase
MRAKKRFGQVFLTDKNYIISVIKAIKAGSRDTLIEIGPGRGAITRGLSEKAKKLVCVEIDRAAVSYLSKHLEDCTNIRLIQADFLKMDIRPFVPKKGKLIIAGNLPYNIASLILLKLIRERTKISRAYVMVQKEVAGRILSGPGNRDFSFLSVAVQSFADVKKILSLPAGAFRPMPKVDSAFLQLHFSSQNNIKIKETEQYFTLVTRSFSQRRKKVINVLSQYYPRDKIDKFFNIYNIDMNARAETLPVKIYVALYKMLY